MSETETRDIDTLFLEERRYPPPAEFAEKAVAKRDIYGLDLEAFWDREGREGVPWYQPFSTLLEWERPYARWYVGGTLKVAYNCVDRHVENGLGDRVAYHWEGEPAGETRTIT